MNIMPSLSTSFVETLCVIRDSCEPALGVGCDGGRGVSFTIQSVNAETSCFVVFVCVCACMRYLDCIYSVDSYGVACVGNPAWVLACKCGKWLIHKWTYFT